MSCGRRLLPIVDLGGPHPFAPGPPGLLVLSTGANRSCSRLLPADTRLPLDLDLLDAHFRMGQTSLWLIERVGLRAGAGLHRWPLGPEPRRWGDAPIGRFCLLGDDGSDVSWHQEAGRSVLLWATQAEAEAALDDPALAGASSILVGRLIDTIDWH